MNRQDFELLVLGTSAATPAYGRNVSGQLLNLAQRLFLIDCGEGTQMQLRRFNARMQSIGHILISHLHGDHFFGLPGLLSSMHLLGRKTPLHLYAPPDLQELLERVNVVSQTRLNYEIIWHTTSDKGLNLLFEDDKLCLYSFPLRHRIFCTGFLFVEKPLQRKVDKEMLEKLKISVADIRLLKNGHDVINSEGKLIKNSEVTYEPPPPRSYAYCSDTIFDEGLEAYFKNVDLLYHESTFLNEEQERAAKTFHSTAGQAAQVALKTGASKLMLGHFSARYADTDVLLQEAQAVFPNTVLAIDGKKISI
mgnify:CR=1 FL=1